MNTEQKNKIILLFRDIVNPIIGSLIISFIFISFFRFSIVNGKSMEPTLQHHQVLLLRISNNPIYGDIVVVKTPDLEVKTIIKRVVALPGDTVEIKDNQLYVNDVPLVEDYIKEPMICPDYKKITLADDEYFVCGDNRNNSMDSRNSMIGTIKKENILGTIVINFSNLKVLK